MNKAQKQKVREDVLKMLDTQVKDGGFIECYTNRDCVVVPEKLQDYLIQKLEDQERELVGRIESKEFYDLMQVYRHTPLVEQELVVMAFENVKKFITKT